MPKRGSWFFRAYVAASALSGALLVHTFVDPQWIEHWFDSTPDGGNGDAERLIAGSLLFALMLISAWLARREHRLLA